MIDGWVAPDKLHRMVACLQFVLASLHHVGKWKKEVVGKTLKGLDVPHTHEMFCHHRNQLVSDSSQSGVRRCCGSLILSLFLHSFFFLLCLKNKAVTHFSSLLVELYQLYPPSHLTLWMWTWGGGGRGKNPVLAKMTRCKPDQRR